MNNFLTVLTIAAAAASLVIIGFVPDNGVPALLFAVPFVIGVAIIIKRLNVDTNFLLRLFICAIAVRILIGTLIYFFNLHEFFGGDANTFDFFGNALLQSWEGDKYSQYFVDLFSGGGANSGWGMLYVVAVIYKVVGRNMLATQYINAVLGASTAPITYLMALEIFPSRKVARGSALLAAFFPSLVLWTAQGLKDGPIIFLLCVSMLATLKLGMRFSVKYLIALILALFALMTLRFYIFYIVAFSIVCALIMGRQRLSGQALIRQFIIMFVIGSALAFFGVARLASRQIDTYGSFKTLQVMRSDASQSAASGFGQDIDVSTPEGALSAIPIGLAYLLLAPFPWQFGSLRQMITLPEMMIWWSAIPFLVFGLWFTIRHRLREVAPILIFTTLLTISYSIIQGNVGTAYRQRAQLLIFYFLFVAVGFALLKEKRNEKARKTQAAREDHLRGVEWKPEGTPRKDQMPVVG
ncbi:MAG: hypothetical protein DMF72_04265 [Acidobacteria bacterium]|nr:MAG: hypothetical protein DMF72_04265 [Acidobacteriota bacterium]